MESPTLPSLAGAIIRDAKLKLNSVEPWATAQIFSTVDYGGLYDSELDVQRQVMGEYHLSILLLDYAVYLSDKQCPIRWDEMNMRYLAENRRLIKIYGGESLENAMTYYIHVNNMTMVRPSYSEGFTEVGCMLRKSLADYCGVGESNLNLAIG